MKFRIGSSRDLESGNCDWPGGSTVSFVTPAIELLGSEVDARVITTEDFDFLKVVGVKECNNSEAENNTLFCTKHLRWPSTGVELESFASPLFKALRPPLRLVEVFARCTSSWSASAALNWLLGSADVVTGCKGGKKDLDKLGSEAIPSGSKAATS
jgi:hypothetical protein